MSMMTGAALAASWMGFLQGLFITVFIVACLLLICVVLVQKGRGGGLSSAFGGAMGSSPFGTKTGDVFTWITVVLAGIFLLCALVLNGVVRPEKAHTGYTEPTPTRQSATGGLPAEMGPPGGPGPSTTQPEE